MMKASSRKKKKPSNMYYRVYMRKVERDPSLAVQHNIHTAFALYSKQGGKLKGNVYATILEFYLKYIKNMLLSEGEFIFPSSLGRLRVIGVRNIKKPFQPGNRVTSTIDWEGTRQMRRRTGGTGFIYHTNDHTHGRYYTCQWGRRKVKYANAKFYKFRIDTRGRKMLSKLVLEGKEYMDFNKNSVIKHIEGKRKGE